MSSRPDSGLDRFLDRTVILGYSTIGYAIRRRGWADDAPAPTALAGMRALVTGAGGGLGEATTLGLARLGARVHLLGRSAQRVAPALARLEQTLGREGLPAHLQAEECDVSDLRSVRRFATGLATRLDADGAALDIVIHNAGALPARRTESADGHELTVATHVLGPILMTELLEPALQRAVAGARVIFVASGGLYTQPLPVGDPEFTRGEYRGAVAYARSKRMQVELLPTLARRWAPDVSVYAMHPGWVDTPGVDTSLPLFRKVTHPILRKPEAGADTAVWLAATQPAPTNATFWHDRQQRPTSYRAATRSTVEQTADLWAWTCSALGLRQQNRPIE